MLKSWPKRMWNGCSWAEESLKKLSESGLKVEKVDVDSEQLIRWCKERSLEINGESRSRYAAERVKALHHKRSLVASEE